MILITDRDFSVDEEIGKLKSKKCGAVCIFLGMVRGEEDLRNIEIEVYTEMAQKKLEEIESETSKKFLTEKIAIIHRMGRLAIGDNILFIGVSAGHREEAFLACRHILEEIKKIVPIWKKEVFADYERWVT